MEQAWLRWYGQAGFLVEGALGRVGIDLFLRPDPRLREPVCEPRDIPRLDAALATHEHHDHRDVYTLQGLQVHHPAMEVVVPDPIRALRARGRAHECPGCNPGPMPAVGGDIGGADPKPARCDDGRRLPLRRSPGSVLRIYRIRGRKRRVSQRRHLDVPGTG